MKRDMDLVRQILLEVEEQEKPSEWSRDKKIDGYTPDQIIYNVHILVQSGLVEAKTREVDKWKIYNLTWSGCDFLDTIREEGIWNETKLTLSEKGYGLAYDIVKSTAIELMKKQLFG